MSGRKIDLLINISKRSNYSVKYKENKLILKEHLHGSNAKCPSKYRQAIFSFKHIVNDFLKI